VQSIQVRIRAKYGKRGHSRLKKDVTGYLYGGDRTRKVKLWKNRREERKNLRKGKGNHSPEVFKELLKK
jgi:translation elongation factor EF-4